jgi:hypothetical protein
MKGGTMAGEKGPLIDLRTLLVVPPDAIGDAPPIYAIPYDVYTSKDFLLRPPAGGIVREMVKYGAAFGYLPNIGIGIGAQCFLVNLRSLRT